jgi:hypothetical protein
VHAISSQPFLRKCSGLQNDNYQLYTVYREILWDNYDEELGNTWKEAEEYQ